MQVSVPIRGSVIRSLSSSLNIMGFATFYEKLEFSFRNWDKVIEQLKDLSDMPTSFETGGTLNENELKEIIKRFKDCKKILKKLLKIGKKLFFKPFPIDEFNDKLKKFTDFWVKDSDKIDELLELSKDHQKFDELKRLLKEKYFEGMENVLHDISIVNDFLDDYKETVSELIEFNNRLSKSYKAIYHQIRQFLWEYYKIKYDVPPPILYINVGKQKKDTVACYERSLFSRKRVIKLYSSFFYGDSFDKLITIAHELFHHVHELAEKNSGVMPDIKIKTKTVGLKSFKYTSKNPEITVIHRITDKRVLVELMNAEEYLNIVSSIISSLNRMSEGRPEWRDKLKKASSELSEFQSFLKNELIPSLNNLVRLSKRYIGMTNSIREERFQKIFNEIFSNDLPELERLCQDFVEKRDLLYKTAQKYWKSVSKYLPLLFSDEEFINQINKFSFPLIEAVSKKRMVDKIFDKDIFSVITDPKSKEVKEQMKILEFYFYSFLNKNYLKKANYNDRDYELLEFFLSEDAKSIKKLLTDDLIFKMITEIKEIYNEGVIDYLAYVFIINYAKGFEALDDERNLMRKSGVWSIHTRSMQQKAVKIAMRARTQKGYWKSRVRILRKGGVFAFALPMLDTLEKRGFIEVRG